jgi:hypothetical protein
VAHEERVQRRDVGQQLTVSTCGVDQRRGSDQRTLGVMSE